MSQSTALDLLLRLSRAHARLIRRLDGRLGALHGLSFGDFAILQHLDAAPERRLRRVDLAEALGLTPAAVTRALIPLEKIGLVKREIDRNDARVGYASLTRAGERLLAHATEAADQASEEALTADAAQLGELSRLVAKLL